MSGSRSWEESLSFSGRLTQIHQLLLSYRRSHPELSPDDAQSKVAMLEESAFQNADSKEEYESLIRTLLSQLGASSANDLAFENASSSYDNSPTSVIGPYKDARFIVTTPSSTIYRASGLTGDSEIVALKLCYPSRDPPPHNSQRELAILQALKHPSIIPLLDSQRLQDSGLLFVFPYMPIDLSAFLSQSKTLNYKQVHSLLHGLLSALEYIHSRGMIHRDIKPSNILLAADLKSASIIDFGTAWSPSLSASSEPHNDKLTDVGTTCYRPPELLFGNRSYDASLDMWAMGCTIFEMLSHPSRPLFESGDLGSELALISSIFHTLGTPDDESWPEAKTFPDWGKMSFAPFEARPWNEILPNALKDARSFVASLVRYESSERLTAEEALNHAFLQNPESM